jgi:hypothetical protein
MLPRIRGILKQAVWLREVDVEKLTVIGIDNGVVTAVSDSGHMFTIELPEDARPAARPRLTAVNSSVSPREIQALLRSGLSVAEVAARTGESTDHVARYEGPVIAELGFILERAQAVEVIGMGDGVTFAEALEHKLEAQGGSILRWQSYRLDDEWIVALSAQIGSVIEDATWTFDSRKLTLTPSNPAAVRLSKVDGAESSLFPALRVVAPTEPIRFDSGQFEPLPPVPPIAAVPVTRPEPVAEAEPAAPADLLEELQRRRGERANAMSSHPSTGSIPIIQLDADGEPIDPTAPAAPVQAQPEPMPAATEPPVFEEPTPSRSQRRTRPNMPTWDEIVFGARPDED